MTRPVAGGVHATIVWDGIAFLRVENFGSDDAREVKVVQPGEYPALVVLGPISVDIAAGEHVDWTLVFRDDGRWAVPEMFPVEFTWLDPDDRERAGMSILSTEAP